MNGHSSLPRVVCIGWLTHAPGLAAIDQLRPYVEFDTIPYQPRPDLIAELTHLARTRGPHIALIIFLSPNMGLLGPCDAELFGPIADKGALRLVTGPGAGYDKVDLAWLASRGISYANSPSAVTEPTAISAVLLILMALRGTSANELTARAGRWTGGPAALGLVVGEDPRGLVLGLVGLGGIGKIVAQRMAAFGMEIHYHTRHPVRGAPPTYIYHPTLPSLLRVSDVLSLHCPLTPQTTHLLSDPEFAQLKQGACVVNTSRGAVIDEDALVRALECGIVTRAALDVFEREPHIHPYLLASPRVTLSPHVAAMTRSALTGMDVEVLANLRELLELDGEGGGLRNAVCGPLMIGGGEVEGER